MGGKEFIVEGVEGLSRIDKVIRKKFPKWGRTSVKKLLNRRMVKVNGKIVWMGSWEVKNGDKVELLEVVEDKRVWDEFDDDWLIADDGDLVVVNKPAGLRSQSTRAKERNNLLDLAKARFGNLLLFHRLDRDTSGVVLFTRRGEINSYLDWAFKSRSIFKEYLAVVRWSDQLKESGKISEYLDYEKSRKDKMCVVQKGGQTAVTNYKLLGMQDGVAVVQLQPGTGRMHQLRVHLAFLKAPILGDQLYKGERKGVKRLMLHAQRIVLPEGRGYQQREFTAKLGNDFFQNTPEVVRSFLMK
jgi:RluA family pseudouridine synthase